MKDGQWYTISGWMGNSLGLRGNDLICFAVIYGFSMDGESQFKGNLDYLTGCMFATQPTALLSLKKLLECNLILKEEKLINGKKHCYYATNVIYNEGDFEVVDSTKVPLVMTTKESLVNSTKEPLAKNNNNKELYNKKKNRLSNDNQKVEYSDDFLAFWSLYHNGSKQQAYKEWNKLKLKEQQNAIDCVNTYLNYCKYSGRKQKDTSSYLHQKGFNEDWLATPDCYVVKPDDNEHTAKFKDYMVINHQELIYHRNPLTVEQIDDFFENCPPKQVVWAMNKLKKRDIHQYFSIAKGIEAIMNEDIEFDEENEEL